MNQDCRKLLFKHTLRRNQMLHLTISGQLRNVNDNSPSYRGYASSPESEYAFLSGNSDEGINDVLVISSLL